MEFIALDSVSLILAAGIFGKIGNALSVILGLGAVIFFHELGHFAVAKWCDVHVERFSIGIGPIIWSRQKGETEYALSALPFGGYVKMLGQDDMDPNQMTSDEIAENPRSYSAKKVWQRMAIISAGVIMNVITGFLFFAIAYRVGVVEQVPMIGEVTVGGPAWEAGIHPGDVFNRIDGVEIQKFMEINQSVVLSSGPLKIDVERPDGSSFAEVVAPRKGKTARRIGCGPTWTSLLSPQNEDPESISISGFAVDDASQPFLPGDRIIKINGEPVQFTHQITRLYAKYAAEEIVYTVERPVSTDKSSRNTEPETDTIEITVPPRPMRTTGLWMAIGEITTIAKGSIAANQGLLVGDRIIKVNDLEVSKDIDPLRLPNFFAEHAGETVLVTVNRKREGDSVESVVLEIIPSDAPGWSERPSSITAPLSISAIGAGFHVLPRIAHIVPGSVAEQAGKFKVGQKISSVELLHPNPQDFVSDLLSDKSGDEINLINPEVQEVPPGKPNWAFVHYMIQTVPLRQVMLHVADNPDGAGSFAHLFETLDPADDWFAIQRGIVGWEALTRVRQAQSLGEAAALGFRETRSSGVSIYLTLRSLFQGNLSVRALSGPLGIVKIGYTVADHGLTRLLMFLGFLSINLAVLNFLPIPVLDGGHMVFLIWEAVARRKPSPRVINWAHGVGLIFIITLFVFVLYLDIFVNGFGAGG
ncbi:MAG: RIP metalloprotease RseP [Fuerstiella sp.]